MQATFPYLVDASLSTGSGLVSDLRFHVFDEHTPLTVANLELLPLPVPHGRGCTNLGFRFQNVAYIADCEAVPDDIVEKVGEKGPNHRLTLAPHLVDQKHRFAHSRLAQI